MRNKIKKKSISYAKCGYYFIAPFFIVYFIFSFIPLMTTFYYSFFESYTKGLVEVGPNFVFLKNYKYILTQTDFLHYLGNTLLLWIIGFIPQITIALLLAVLFTSTRLNLKMQGFFKTIIYMPNVIMAAALAMLYFSIFTDSGPINQMLMQLNIISEPKRFLTEAWWVRGMIAHMNFLLWFGNTTILLMAGIMGIDQTYFEAATVDGASSFQVFKNITMPLLAPIFLYVIITAMIGGIQMFDVPQILTNGNGNPDRTSMTMIMHLNNYLYSKNYGLAGVISIYIFILTSFLSLSVYKITIKAYKKPEDFKKKGGIKL